MLTREVAVAGDISTHILTKRMTRTLHGNQQRIVISTHILTKRMTIIQKAIQQSKMYFNSHPHEEDDHQLDLKM